MNSWQITKYNPIYFDENGRYIKDEWTRGFPEIGRDFDGGKFEANEYFFVENKYAKTITTLMDILGLTELQVSQLEHKFYYTEKTYYFDDEGKKIVIDEDLKARCEEYFKENLEKYQKFYTTGMVDLFYHIQKGQWLNKSQVEDAIKMNLRGHFGFELSFIPKLTVYFGWDYYMYVCGDLEYSDVCKSVESTGLFIKEGGYDRDWDD